MQPAILKIWNQQLKHLNVDGIFAKSCFKSMPSEIFQRLSKLSTTTKVNETRIENFYPQQFQLDPHQSPKIVALIEQPELNEWHKTHKASISEEGILPLKGAH